MSLMKKWIDSWGKSGRSRRRKPTNRLRGQLETLETRYLLASVLTYHNDAAKTGQNLEETVLTRANVNVNTFGKVFSVTLDGDVYAQPLVKENVNITVGPHAGVRDVVFVATQHGSLYAIDGSARSGSGQGLVLWKRSLLNVGLPGATAVEPVKRSDVGAGYLESVITSTPVINGNTMYVLAKTRETVNGEVHFVQRIHAINISSGYSTTGAFLIGDTVHQGGQNFVNKSPVWVNGTGDGNDGQGHVYFNAMREYSRTALTLFNGVVYIGWASHEGIGPYHGWVLGFDANTLALRAAFCTTPNGGLGGIWQSGGGFATDGTALYFQTGNGTFDGSNGNLITPTESGPVTGLDANGFPHRGNYGNSMVKVVPDASTSVSNQNINGWGLKVVDYFTPFNQKFLEDRDLDLGSGAPMMLPDEVGSAAHPHLMVGAGKQGIMYLVDRDNMGKFSTKNRIVQTVEGQLSSSFDTPAYYDGKIYYVEGFGGTAKTFSIANGVMSSSPTSRSHDSYAYAGSTPSISANGKSNGIVWDVDRGTNQLRAYSTDSYATQLYHSGQAAGNRDLLGAAATFQVPTVANGHVYLGTASGASSTLVAYGLIQPPTAAPAAPSNLRALTVTGTQAQLAWQANDTSPNIATGYLLQKSSDGGQSWTPVSSGVATSFTAGELQKTTTYKFRVAATNSIGTSAFSNVITVTTTSAASGFDFSSGFPATTGDILLLNGAAVTNGALVLTDGTPSQFRDVFSKVMQDITKFTTSFDFQISPGPSSHGFMFVIQSDIPNAVPAKQGANIGEGLAYGSMQHTVYPHSVAIKFDLFRSLDQYEESGDYISTTGLYQNGAVPTSPEIDLLPAGIDLHSGHRMRATVDYDFGAKQLSLTITDVVNGAQFTRVFNDLDLPQAVGGAAFVGFTAATSKKESLAPTQRILSWKFASEGPPNAPANLRTQLLGQTPGVLNPPPLSVRLNWSPVPKAQGYIVERRYGLVGNYDVIATLTGGGTQYTDVSLGTQAHYFYRLKAFNSAGESPYSSDVVASTPGRVPTPRFGQTTAVTETSIAMKWTDMATNEDGFHIRRRFQDSDYTLVAVLPPHPGTGVMTFVDSGLQRGTVYDYHIEAFNLAGYSDYTGVNTVTAASWGPPQAFFEYLTSPRQTAADGLMLRFSKAVSGFSKEDLVLTRNGASVPIAGATTKTLDSRTYLIDLSTLTTADGYYQLTLNSAGSGIVDASNNALSNNAQLLWRKDTRAPSIVSFAQVDPAAGVGLTNAAQLKYQLKLSEPVSAIPVRPEFSFGLSAQGLVVSTEDNKNFTITASPLSGSGTFGLSLNDVSSAIHDVAGNILPLASYPAGMTIVVDRAPPAVSPTPMLLEKGSSAIIPSAQLLATDGRVGPEAITYRLMTLPQHITLKLGGVALAANDTFTQLDVNTQRVSLTHDNTSTSTSDSVKFTVSDGLNTSVTKTMLFTVTPFNARPTLEPLPFQQTPLNTPLVISGALAGDRDAGQSHLRMTIAVSVGTVSLSTTAGLTMVIGSSFNSSFMTFTGSLANINRAIENLKYTPQTGFLDNARIKFDLNDMGKGGTRVAKSIQRQVVVSVLEPGAVKRLTFGGGGGDDTMRVDVDATHVQFTIGEASVRHVRGQLESIDIYGYGGSDSILIEGTQGLAVNVFGGDGNDELTVASTVMTGVKLAGGFGNDVLTGGSGGDMLNGGPGSDRLVGATGSDRYVFANAGTTLEIDTVVELVKGGVDALDFGAVNTPVTVDLRLDGNLALQAGRRVATGGAGQFAHFEGVVGGKGADKIRGNSAPNFLAGAGGSDIISGFDGNDTLVGADGFDILNGGNGNDALRGGQGNDTYVFAAVAGTTAETDSITEVAGQGIDTLDFWSLPTAVVVDLGNDTLATHLNRKLVTAAVGQFAFFENAIGGAAGDTLKGNFGPNMLSGQGGNDLLLGFGGFDTLIGGDGNDRLAGGDGSDLVRGGLGDDAYEFADVKSGSDETDVVIEWVNGGNDLLNFRGVTTPVTVNLKGNPLATHALRTIKPGAAAEFEQVHRAPAATTADLSQAAVVPTPPDYEVQVDQWMAQEDDDDELPFSLTGGDADLFGE